MRAAHAAGAVDWRLPNVVLAAEFGACQKAVGRVRGAVGSPRAAWQVWRGSTLPVEGRDAQYRQRVRAVAWRPSPS